MKAIRALPGEIESAGHVVNAADRAEMAVPSYTHWNPLIRWVFWKRLDVAVELAGLRPGIRVLDFGVGTGVLARTLASAGASRIVGVDVLLGPAEEMGRRTGISVELVPAGELEKFSQAHQGGFDCVFALDVLEHVSDAELTEISGRFLPRCSHRAGP